MVVEYKPSHKLSVFNLRAGLLRADKGSMNIPEEVINRITIPTDPEVSTQEGLAGLRSRLVPAGRVPSLSSIPFT